MKQVTNTKLSADKDWIAEMAKSVKEDQSVIQELAKRFEKRQEARPPSIKEQVDDILEDAAYAKEVLSSTVEFTMTAMAKDLGMTGAPRLQAELEETGIIYRQGVTYHLKSEFCGYGLTAYRTYKGEPLLVWTQKGRAWLHNLKKRGLLMIEPKPRKSRYGSESQEAGKSVKTTRELAKMLGMKTSWLEEWLHKASIVIWNEQGVIPSGIYVLDGYAEKRSCIKDGHEEFYPVWTEKGVEWIKELMKKPDPHRFLRNQMERRHSCVADDMDEGKQEAREVRMPKSVTNPDILFALIAQIQLDFECIVTLAKNCISEKSETMRRLLKGDIRDIHDTTTLMMRRLEDECYKALA